MFALHFQAFIGTESMIASEVMEVDEVLADMTLEVDATEAPSHWLRSRMIFHHYLGEILKSDQPTADIILHYPKWMPSTTPQVCVLNAVSILLAHIFHYQAGMIQNVCNLKFLAITTTSGLYQSPAFIQLIS